MITLDTILITAEISALILLIGLLIYSISDYYEEIKSDEIEDYPSLNNEEDTHNTIIINDE
jgi:hypothetical protein